jgi:hypothetical protein
MQTLNSILMVLFYILFYVNEINAQDESLVAYWTFDDSTAYDSSGYEHHGVVSGNPQIIPGMKGNAIQFDGIDDYIRVDDTDLLDTDTTMTLCLWVKPDSITSGGSKFISKWYSSPTEGDWLFSLSSQDSCDGNCVSWYMAFANYHVISADSAWVSIGPPTVEYFFQMHDWNFVAVTFDSGHIKAYFNGQYINESFAPYTYTSLAEYGSDDIYIGQYHRRDRPFYNFKGGLDEIRLYNRALTDDEIIALYLQVTDIEKLHTSIPVPDNYFLAQNYPNPFNPKTIFSFILPVSGFVTLDIYNTRGQKVAILLNKKMNAGRHNVQFDASRLPSGIYFYRLQVGNAPGRTGGFSQTKKMVLIK